MRSPEELWNAAGNKGEGVRIALLDTGVDRAHPDFSQADIICADICSPGGKGTDVDGHGTQCAGIILQVAPRCTLLSGRIMDAGGGFTYDALFGGLHWASVHKADIICVCSGERYSDPGVERILDQLASNGCTMVAAIGNHGRTGSNAGVFPARSKFSLAVGSADLSGALLTFTDLPTGMDVFCPPLDSFDVPILNGLRKQITGTSASAAWMAGVLGLYLNRVGKPENSDVILDLVRDASGSVSSPRGQYRVLDYARLFSRAL